MALNGYTNNIISTSIGAPKLKTTTTTNHATISGHTMKSRHCKTCRSERRKTTTVQKWCCEVFAKVLDVEDVLPQAVCLFASFSAR